MKFGQQKRLMDCVTRLSITIISNFQCHFRTAWRVTRTINTESGTLRIEKESVVPVLEIQKNWGLTSPSIIKGAIQ